MNSQRKASNQAKSSSQIHLKTILKRCASKRNSWINNSKESHHFHRCEALKSRSSLRSRMYWSRLVPMREVLRPPTLVSILRVAKKWPSFQISSSKTWRRTRVCDRIPWEGQAQHPNWQRTSLSSRTGKDSDCKKKACWSWMLPTNRESEEAATHSLKYLGQCAQRRSSRTIGGLEQRSVQRWC